MIRIIIDKNLSYKLQYTDKVYHFVFGLSHKELPELIKEMKDVSEVQMQIEYKDGAFIVLSDFVKVNKGEKWEKKLKRRGK